MVIWTFQPYFRWRNQEIGFGRRLDAVVKCYGWLWKIDIRNRTLSVDCFLAALGVKR